MVDKIAGIYAPMVTPFTAAEEIDEAALRQDVRYMIERGHVHGLVVGGSTGEGHTLTGAELRRAVGAALDEAAGRLPVMAGVIVDSTREAVERAHELADLPVAALQVTPVHYLFRPSDEMMLRHFAAVAEASRAPVIIYNVVPWSYCSPQLLVRMIREVDGVIGVKQSARDMKMLADLLLLLEGDGIVFSAVDALLYPSFALGAQGAIAAILSAVPGLCVALWDAVQCQDHKAALDLHRKLLTLWNALEADNLPANVKTAMALQGRPGGALRSPMPASSPEQTAAIRRALVGAGLLNDAS